MATTTNPYNVSYSQGDNFTVNNDGTAFDYAQQRQETSDFLKKYQTALEGQESQTAARSRIQDALGYSDLAATNNKLKGNLRSLNNNLTNLPETTAKASTGSLMTQGQVDNAVATKGARLSRSIAGLSNLQQGTADQLETTNTMVQEGVDDVVANNTKMLQGLEKEYDQMQIQQAREFTGYTTDMQSELSRLTTNVANGLTISENEKDRLQELAVLEKQFQNNLALQKAAGENAIALKQTDPSDWDVLSQYYGSTT